MCLKLSFVYGLQDICMATHLLLAWSAQALACAMLTYWPRFGFALFLVTYVLVEVHWFGRP